MSESKHTPGPWSVSESHPHTVVAGEFTYRPHWPGIGNGNEMDANARLIAAAPKLLEALRMIVEGPWPDGIDDPLKQAIWDEKIARGAIALVEP